MEISPEDKIGSILPKIKKARTLVVFDGKNYFGIISDRTVLNPNIDPNTKVKHLAVKAPLIKKEYDLQKIATLFLHGFRELPLIEKKKVELVSFKDILKKLLEEGRIPNVRVSEVELIEINKIDKEKSIAEAVALLKEKNIHHLGVTENGKLIGILSSADLFPYIGRVKEKVPIFREKIVLNTIKISSIPFQKVYTISEDKSLIDAAKMMMENDVLTLVCMDKFLHFYNLIKLALEEKKVQIEISGLKEEDVEYREDIRKEMERLAERMNKVLPVDIVRLHVKTIRESGERRRYDLHFLAIVGMEKIVVDSSDWEIHKAVHYIKEEVEKILKEKKERLKGKKVGKKWRKLAAEIREGEYIGKPI
ncbi:MAG: CBS domain-containing protein [Candidatus Micrarchaeia archaeon]